jgi:hypothetical protein
MTQSGGHMGWPPLHRLGVTLRAGAWFMEPRTNTPGQLLQRLPVDAVLGHDRDPAWVTARSVAVRRPRYSSAISSKDRPGANLGHRFAVDFHPQYSIRQQEQLLTPLALLDQGPARLERLNRETVDPG